jgi:hypothetical protein
MTPKSLSEIWQDISCTTFRVRNVETLEDYLITEIKNWAQGRPYLATCTKGGDKHSLTYCLECWSRKYALLSNQDEIEYFKTLSYCDSNSPQMSKLAQNIKETYAALYNETDE